MTTMATTTSLLDWILSLLRDPAQQAAFQVDPQGYASDHGFSDLSAADVHDALCLAGDNQSQNYRGDHDSHVHYPPPHHYEHGESATHYLNSYITNNYTSIDARSTNIDDSVHQNVDTHGGDFSQNIHNDPVVASGDGAVAAGHDIRDSTLTTGDRNVVGDNNHAVTGSDNTTAFGTGAATNADLSHASFGDGAAASIGGNAEGHAEHNDTSTSVHGGDGPTSVNAAGDHANANAIDDQHSTDSSTHVVYDDHSHTDSHNELNSHDQAHLNDSHNTDIHHA
jgi:hypothetical protein